METTKVAEEMLSSRVTSMQANIAELVERNMMEAFLDGYKLGHEAAVKLFEKGGSDENQN